MDHLAIISQGWREKIISGRKIIESRWYNHRVAPWRGISAGDRIYFKETGQDVDLTAEVTQVLFYENLDPQKVREIYNQYGRQICLDEANLSRVSGKRYCILMFLANPREVPPFKINKSGYGMGNAWISVDDIRKLMSTKT